MIKTLTKIFRILLWFLRVNWLKTIYFNFRLLPLKVAYRLPVIIYGKIKLKTLKGTLVINAPIRMGIVQFGKAVDDFPLHTLPIKLHLSGTLVFNGPIVITGGSTITVWGGIMTFGKKCYIGSGVTIKCIDGIEIGDLTRIVGNCIIMDTNVHYIRNTKTGIVQKAFDKIKIGKYCWINAGTTINKGTVLPDYCIVARNSLLNKDYTNSCPQASFLAGSPAELKTTNNTCIFSEKEEKRLKDFFLKNPEVKETESFIDFPSEESEITSLFRLF